MSGDGRLWRASAETRGSPMPDLLGAFEGEALSVSIFEIEDPATAAALGWRVELLFRERPDASALAQRLRASCDLASVEVEAVAAEDWVAAAELRLPPVRAGRFVIHGSHARPDITPALEPIEIDAGLAFGSGDHATTRACLLAIDRLARRRRFRRVLDLGSGSGVLAIAAGRCWPARLVAVDNDPVAVRVARRNLRRNLPGCWAVALAADGYRHPTIRRAAPFDLVLANILADPLAALAPDLARYLATDGRAVLSGLLDRQAGAVIAAHRRCGLVLASRLDIGPWVALVLRHRRASPGAARAARPLTSGRRMAMAYGLVKAGR